VYARERKEKAKEEYYHVYLIIDGDIIHYWTHKLFWTLIRLSKQTPNLHIPFEPIIYNDSHD
jgi:hypothetical protein|tara:strand:- start:386 stop:571 length:186 start_codon:yes stop_codon:yes gene_type:complete